MQRGRGAGSGRDAAQGDLRALSHSPSPSKPLHALTHVPVGLKVHSDTRRLQRLVAARRAGGRLGGRWSESERMHACMRAWRQPSEARHSSSQRAPAKTAPHPTHLRLPKSYATTWSLSPCAISTGVPLFSSAAGVRHGAAARGGRRAPAGRALRVHSAARRNAAQRSRTRHNGRLLQQRQVAAQPHHARQLVLLSRGRAGRGGGGGGWAAAAPMPAAAPPMRRATPSRSRPCRLPTWERSSISAMAPPCEKPPTTMRLAGMPASTCCCTRSSTYLTPGRRSRGRDELLDVCAAAGQGRARCQAVAVQQGRARRGLTVAAAAGAAAGGGGRRTACSRAWRRRPDARCRCGPSPQCRTCQWWLSRWLLWFGGQAGGPAEISEREGSGGGSGGRTSGSARPPEPTSQSYACRR